MRRFENEEKGSAVVLVVFILALGIGGFFYTQMDKVVREIDNIVENSGDDVVFASTDGAPLSDDTTYRFYVWFFTYATPTLIMIGLALFFIRSLRKDRYETM